MKKLCVILFISIVAILSCRKLEPKTPLEDQVLDGPVEGLTAEQNQQFLNGDVAFNNDVFTKETGLGPMFVSTSCGSCHAGDGKGHPFTTLIRFGQRDSTGNKYLHMGAPQLQNRAISGYKPEQIPDGVHLAKFTPPANTGMGYIDALADATLLAMADPDDANGDGISGVPNWIPFKKYLTERTGAIARNEKYIGRFGKKAGAYDLLQQTASAYNQDIGITSTYEPIDTYTGHEIDPEVTNQTVLNVVFYLTTLKAPIQRNASHPDVVKGKELFLIADCGKCHMPELKTGPSDVIALNYKTFYPYTDVLLHDMGPDLDDGYTEGNATTAEWRTPALWGLGLSRNSQGGEYYLMHDGRARSIEQAILMHGGEGTGSRNKYIALTDQDKKKILTFLESL